VGGGGGGGFTFTKCYYVLEERKILIFNGKEMGVYVRICPYYSPLKKISPKK